MLGGRGDTLKHVPEEGADSDARGSGFRRSGALPDSSDSHRYMAGVDWGHDPTHRTAGCRRHIGGDEFGRRSLCPFGREFEGPGVVPGPVRIESNGFWGQSGFEAGTIYRATPIQSRTIFSPPFREAGSPQTELNFTRRTRGILLDGPRPAAERESSPPLEKSP